MPGETLTSLYVDLSARGLELIQDNLGRVTDDANVVGQAFVDLAKNTAKSMGDLENRPRLIAAAMRSLIGETEAAGTAFAQVQGSAGQSGAAVAGASTAGTASGPTTSGGGAPGGGGTAGAARSLNANILAGAIVQLHNFTLATVAAEAKTAALMYAMQSPGIKGYATALAQASVAQTEFDASINLERLKGLGELLGSPAFQKTSFLAGVAEQLNGFTASTTAAQAKAEALSQAIGSGAASRYGQALAAAGKEQEKFTAAVRFEQISAQSGRFAASLDALKGKMAQLGQATSSAFGGATSMITSFARAGLSGTTMGERLGLQFTLLSREIASLFIPVLERVIGVLQSVTSWFRNLSGPQQAFIGGIAATAIALVAVAAIIPRIIGGLQGMAAVFTLLSANPFIALVGLIAALLVGTESGRSALGRLAAAFGPIVTAVGQLFAALKPVIDLLGSVVGAVADFIGGIASGIASGIEAVTDFLGFTSEADRRRSAQQQAQQRQQAGRDRQEVAGTTRGREGLEATFLRFQEAALKTGQGDTAMRQLTEAQRQTALLRQMTGNMSEPAPPAIG